MTQIHTGKGPPNDEVFAKMVALPNILSEDTKALFIFSRDQATSQEIEWIGHVRASASTPEPGTGARIQQVDVEGPNMLDLEKLVAQKRNLEGSGLENIDYEADSIARDDTDVENMGSSNDEDDDGEDQEDNLEDDDPEDGI